MTELGFQWDSEENAWVSDTLAPDGNIMVHITLKKASWVIVKKRNHEDDAKVEIYRRDNVDDLTLTFTGEPNGKLLNIYTSEEIKNIKYANL